MWTPETEKLVDNTQDNTWNFVAQGIKVAMDLAKTLNDMSPMQKRQYLLWYGIDKWLKWADLELFVQNMTTPWTQMNAEQDRDRDVFNAMLMYNLGMKDARRYMELDTGHYNQMTPEEQADCDRIQALIDASVD